MLGTTEIIVIGLIIVLLFGASSIPKIAKSLGQAKKEFKKGMNDAEKKKEEEVESVSVDESLKESLKKAKETNKKS